MKTILMPVDFTDVTPAVVAAAGDLAQKYGAAIHIVHVAEPNPDFVGYQTGPKSVRDAEAGALRDEHQQLQDIAVSLRADGIEAHSHLVHGPTVEKILEELDKLEADFVVIGSHGHNPVYRFLLGSTTEGLIRKERCPVLVVPSEKK